MKINCDVCNNHEASVYCSADEAALCSACDHRVHHANKLAGKHPRFSLLLPSPESSPTCDICQEKKAFIFCQQDRAILCKDCDLAIHKANQHTLNHNRFLLTGVKLSPSASVYSSSPSSVSNNNNTPVKLSSKQNGVVGIEKERVVSVVESKKSHDKEELNGSGTSSISEYLIDMLPGWHVEDFLDPPANLSKVGDNDPGPFWGNDLIDGSANNSSYSPESMGIWVPQAPPPVQPARYSHAIQQFETGSNIGFGDHMVNGSSVMFGQNGYNNVSKITSGIKTSRRIPDNGNCFMVPQISPSSTSLKRSRTVWQ